jgi:starch phosphorylase
MVDWQHNLEQQWATLHFGEVKIVSEAGKHGFEVQLYFGSLDANSIKVELYADGVNGGKPERHEMKRGQQLTDTNGFSYRAEVPATRPATDYTARVIPQHDGVAVPLEANRILWQR